MCNKHKSVNDLTDAEKLKHKGQKGFARKRCLDCGATFNNTYQRHCCCK